jgi:hypothetical protein
MILAFKAETDLLTNFRFYYVFIIFPVIVSRDYSLRMAHKHDIFLVHAYFSAQHEKIQLSKCFSAIEQCLR